MKVWDTPSMDQSLISRAEQIMPRVPSLYKVVGEPKSLEIHRGPTFEFQNRQK